MERKDLSRQYVSGVANTDFYFMKIKKKRNVKFFLEPKQKKIENTNDCILAVIAYYTHSICMKENRKILTRHDEYKIDIVNKRKTMRTTEAVSLRKCRMGWNKKSILKVKA